LCRHFGADAVIVVGSQAILATWPDAPVVLRSSGEIDAFPANAKDWEARHDVEASEEIFALFGEGSTFHQTHGFYIDGVDETTALLPRDWRQRQVTRVVTDGDRTYRAIVPEVHDLVISKLCRLDIKDAVYVEALHRARPLDKNALEGRLVNVDTASEVKQRATAFVADLH
jgi:hypothetical protein